MIVHIYGVQCDNFMYVNSSTMYNDQIRIISISLSLNTYYCFFVLGNFELLSSSYL
jgi:hypothetical protein